MNAAPKVIALNSRGGASVAGERIFGECRDLMHEALTQWLNALAGSVAEELFALADATRDRVQQTRCLDLRAIVEKDWSVLVDKFRRELLAEAQRCATPGAPVERAKPAATPAFEGLTLVDDDDLSQHIVVREFAAMLSEACADELYALERRVGALLGWGEAPGMNNPLAPAVLCHALSDACAAVVADGEARLVLLRRLQQHLLGALPAIYRTLNAYLIERGVLPEIKRSYRRTAGGGNAAPTGATGAMAELPAASPGGGPSTTSEATGYAGATGGEPRAESAVLSGEAILGALRRLAQLHGGRDASPTPSIEPAPIAPAGGSGVAVTVDAALLASLDALQHSAPDVPGAPIVNRVRELSDSDKVRAAGGLEAVTIDIIAMLFDFIFDDTQIPVAVKALVSRLQIPVLKVAMLDPGFFAERQHPARRFLGSISGISIRWGDSVDESDPFFRKLAQIVERIQNEFESDVGIFGTALAELEDFVARHQSEDEDTALAAANIVNLRELQNSAWQRAQQTVNTFCRTAQPPPVIASFLAEHWAAVLQTAAVAGDERAWQSSEQAMRDLEWSVAPKKTPDDRLRLIKLLPGLLAQLKRGLVAVNARSDECAAFFDALLPYHAAALKGEAIEAEAETASVPPSGEPPAEPAAAIDIVPGDGEGDLLVTRSVDDGVEVEEVMLVGARALWRPDEQDIASQVDELKRGDWVEFGLDTADEGDDGAAAIATHRERLNWISPQRGILLFSNHRAAKAISIAPDALVRQIRDGKARIVPPPAIFERALNGALASAHVLDGADASSAD